MKKSNKILKSALIVTLITIFCLFQFKGFLYKSYFYFIDIDNHSINNISLCMKGDLLIHKDIYNYAYNETTQSYNFDYIFENIKKYIQQYDIKVVNGEVLIAGKEYGVSTFPRFNSPFELADSVVKAGFNVILKATNHVNDLNETALSSDLNNWKKYKDIIVTGSYLNDIESRKISYFIKNNIKIALLNYCKFSNRKSKHDYTMNRINYEKIKNDIIKARSEGSDFIIVFPHWGKEYILEENEFQKKWAKIFLELGVDLVIGTHPHVIQPLKVLIDEKTNKKLYIFYSLGNFINATSGRGKNIFHRFLGGMAHVIIGKDIINNKVIIKDIKFIPLITHIFNKENKSSTFKVKDYNKTMCQNNLLGFIYDNSFSYENMINHFKTIIDEKFLDFNI